MAKMKPGAFASLRKAFYAALDLAIAEIADGMGHSDFVDIEYTPFIRESEVDMDSAVASAMRELAEEDPVFSAIYNAAMCED